jgi:BolA protein
MSFEATVQAAVQLKLQGLFPVHLDVINESHMHNVPEGAESHFNVTVVSEQFQGKMLVARHRMVNQVLAEELSGKIHALALHTFTPDEWFEKSGQSQASPACLGGSKV